MDVLFDGGLRIFRNRDGIEVDKTLKKFTSIEKEVKEFKDKALPHTTKITDLNEEGMDLPTDDLVLSQEEMIKLVTSFKDSDYSFIIDSDTKSVNIFVSTYLFKDIFSVYNSYNTTFVGGQNIGERNVKDQSPKKWYQTLAEKFHTKSSELERSTVIDVLEFFRQIKGLSKEQSETYVNRLKGYIIALKNTDMNGQTALKEKLLRDMVINKYESILYAKGLYYVVSEDQVVDFIKKTDKGVELTYVKNYLRVIPPQVTKLIVQLNELLIFDNYCILHYDPEKKSYAQTIEEQKRETQKRRDPILFGLIRGSNKLYYITDWVDEFCDLTLDKFVETLQIEKDSLKMKEDL